MKRNISLIQVIGVYWTWYVMLLLADIAWLLLTLLLRVPETEFREVGYRSQYLAIAIFALGYTLIRKHRILIRTTCEMASVLKVNRLIGYVQCRYNVHKQTYTRWVRVSGVLRNGWPRVGDSIPLLVYRYSPDVAHHYDPRYRIMVMKPDSRIDHGTLSAYALICILCCMLLVPIIVIAPYRLVRTLLNLSGLGYYLSGFWFFVLRPWQRLTYTRSLYDVDHSLQLRGMAVDGQVTRVVKWIRFVTFSYELEGITFHSWSFVLHKEHFDLYPQNARVKIDVSPLTPRLGRLIVPGLDPRQARNTVTSYRSNVRQRDPSLWRALATDWVMQMFAVLMVVLVFISVVLFHFGWTALGGYVVTGASMLLVGTMGRMAALMNHFEYGTVIPAQVTQAECSGECCRVTYRYEVEGQEYTGQGRVPVDNSGMAVNVGGTLSVSVNPRHPQKSLALAQYYKYWAVYPDPPRIR